MSAQWRSKMDNYRGSHIFIYSNVCEHEYMNMGLATLKYKIIDLATPLPVCL